MASASSSYYISFLFAMLCMCIHLFAGALAPKDSSMPSPAKKSDSVPPGSHTPTPPPAPAPAPASASSPALSRSPAPTPFNSPLSVPTSFSESAKHKRGRILGLVLILFAGLLQAFVVLFLFVKRRQMLKHVHRSRDHRDPPHIWSNPYKEADTDCKQVHFGITRSPNLFMLKLGRVLAAIKEGMCVM